MRMLSYVVLCMLLATALAACRPAMPSKPTAATPRDSAGPTATPLPKPTPSPTPSPTPTPTPSPTPSPEELQAARLEAQLHSLSLRERVEQLFIIRIGPTNARGYDRPGDTLSAFLSENSPGGYILFPNNITGASETRALLDHIAQSATIAPFFAIDEEGGTVSRLRSAGLAGYDPQPSARAIGRSGDPDEAYAAGEAIAAALTSIGVNLNFAPVADLLPEGGSGAIGSRAYGGDPEQVARMACAFQRALLDGGILSAPKHFPGHGAASGDSHEGQVSVLADAEALAAAEYIPFISLIQQGAPFILVGHITASNADPSGLPATLSPYFATEVLREQLGFEGIIITDAMDMGAIARRYSSADAAVLAIQAGIDMILMPTSYRDAVEGIVAAVEEGTISRQRIDRSVYRILRYKDDLIGVETASETAFEEHPASPAQEREDTE